MTFDEGILRTPLTLDQLTLCFPTIQERGTRSRGLCAGGDPSCVSYLDLVRSLYRPYRRLLRNARIPFGSPRDFS